jgi:hypothetical protein
MNTSDREEILMDTGATVKAALKDGATVELALDAWVPVDPSCYQYDSGWWAYNTEDEADEYFVSTSGIVYGAFPTKRGELEAFQTEVGHVVCNVCGAAGSQERCNEFQIAGECRKVFAS